MRKLVGLLAATTIAFQFSTTAFAEEKLENYIYNDDGTYHKVGDGSAGVNGAGYIEADYGKTFANTAGASIDSWGIRGSYGRKFFTDWHVQGDLGYLSIGTGALSATFTNLHISKDLNENIAVGAFFQTASLSPINLIQHAYGAEAIRFGENNSIWGRVGYVTMADTAMGSVGGSYYFNENTRLGLQASVAEDFWSFSGKASYRTKMLPNATVFGSYRLESIASTTISTVSAGLRYSFGSSSLQDEERNGVRWQPNDAFLN